MTAPSNFRQVIAFPWIQILSYIYELFII